MGACPTPCSHPVPTQLSTLLPSGCRICLANCGITNRDGVAGVAQCLALNKSLQEVDIEGNALRQEEMSDCAKCLGDVLKVGVRERGRAGGAGKGRGGRGRVGEQGTAGKLSLTR